MSVYINLLNKQNKAQQAFKLIIQLQKSVLNVLLCNAQNNTIAYLQSIEVHDGVVNENTFTTALAIINGMHIEKSCVGLDDEKFVIIPNEMKTQDMATKSIAALYHIETSDEILETNIKGKDYYGVFVAKTATKKFLENILPAAQLVNSNVCLLPAYNDLVKKENIDYIFIALQTNQATISVFKNAKLQLHKTFSIDNNVELVYTICKIVQDLQLDNTSIFIHGIDAEKIKTSLLAHYKTVQICPNINGFIYPDNYKDATFFTLFAIAQSCE